VQHVSSDVTCIAFATNQKRRTGNWRTKC